MSQEPGLGEVNPAIEEASRLVIEHLGLAGKEWSCLLTLGQLAQAAAAKEAGLPGQRPWDYAFGAASEILFSTCSDRAQPGYSLAYHWLRRYVYDLCKNQFKLDNMSAEDLAGDIVEIIIKKRGQVRFATAFLAWTVQVARNAFKEFLARKARNNGVALPGPGEAGQSADLEKVGILKVTEAEIEDTSPGADPEETVLNRELRVQILDTIRAMRANTHNSHLYRRIIVGFYFEDKNIEEIAGLLGLTPVKVTKLKSQALLNFRKAWQKYGY